MSWWSVICLGFVDATIEQVDWDTSKIRDKLRRDIDAHLASVRSAKISQLNALYEVC